jgi:arginyl-tRNA synthetase
LDPLVPEQEFVEGVKEAAARAIDARVDAVPLTYPPSPGQGDLATPVCFELAKALRRPPRALADAIASAYEPSGGIARVEAAGGGYLNAYLDRRALLEKWLFIDRSKIAAGGSGKTIVEHTNINPNKAAHIGHLRNAVLGDTLVRCLRQLGDTVEVQNYIDDTGVQVADLVVGFRVLRGEDLSQVRDRYGEDALRQKGERFDYVAWDVYSEVTRYYEEDSSRLRHREETLHLMEAGGNPVAEMAAYLSRRMVRHHLETMLRIGVRYDLLPKESDILAHRFWDQAFQDLQRAGAIRLATAGKNAGCWVIDLPDVEKGVGEDEKVIVRSNGTVTYVGKDIAYQLWKLGLLRRDFDYALFDWTPGPPRYDLWATTHARGAADHPTFGRGHRVYNVIDSGQSYPQRVVKASLLSLGHAEEAERSIHFAYSKVVLTPAAVAALFPAHQLSEEDRERRHLEMSGRKGLGVKAEDLIDALVARAAEEVRKRNPDFETETVRKTADRIAIGALRYYMLRFTRNREIAFDLDDALAFEGETGPYLQYSVVRARNILAKVAERHGAAEIEPAAAATRADLGVLGEDPAAEHWHLAMLLARVPHVLRQAVDSLELSTVAKHAYVAAQAFNSFYHRYPVAQEADPVVRATRVALVHIYHDGMVHLMRLMGIEVPLRM